MVSGVLAGLASEYRDLAERCLAFRWAPRWTAKRHAQQNHGKEWRQAL